MTHHPLTSIIVAAALVLATPVALAQVYKCKNAQGKIELTDTACGTSSSASEKLMERPAAPRHSDGHAQDTIARQELKADRDTAECHAARETLRHRDNYLNRTAMRQACGLAEPAPRARTSMNCSTFTQGIGGGQAIGTTTCR